MQKKITQPFSLFLVYILKKYSCVFAFLPFLISAFIISATEVKGEIIHARKIIKTTGTRTPAILNSSLRAATRTSFVADNPQPTLTSLSKTCITYGYNQDLKVTLTGENFVQGAKVRITGTSIIPFSQDFTPDNVSADGKIILSTVPLFWLQFFLPGQYRIQVVNPAPAVQEGISNSLIFTVYASINTGPVTGNPFVCPNGSGVVYSVPAVAGASYIWGLPRGATIISSSGGNQITLNFNDAVSGTLSVTAINGCGDPGTTSTLEIIVNSPPVIDRISSGVPVCINQGITITVEARGTNLNYRWYKRAGSATSNGFPLTDGGTISGANSSTLNISNAVAADAGYYYVVVGNTCNPVGIQSINSLIITNPVYTNTIKSVEEPEELLINNPATYSVTPDNRSLVWQYTWTIFYNTNPATSETHYTGTNPNFRIASVRPDMLGIRVMQSPPEGIPCVSAKGNVVNLFRTPLPVELVYLKATKQDQDVVAVEWATASEQNSEGFEIQVSQDAQNYRTLAFVASKAGGNTNQQQVYTFYDKENGKYGTRYYRLQQRDMNGDTEYFGPKAVLIGEATTGLNAYPNPFNQEITLALSTQEAGMMHVIVTNAIGGKVLERTLKIEKGSNKQVLRFNQHLPQGIYHITTRLNSKVEHFKLLKQP